MFDKNSKFPRFFILMLVPIALIMLIGMFFSVKIVGSVYLFALIIAFVFLMLDRHHGENLTNYKLSCFLFDLINLIAVIAITYYEYKNHTMVLNIFLVVLIVVLLLSIIADVVIIRCKDISKKKSVFISIVKMGAMICILTYFYNVSNLFFAVDALIFEIANVIIKLFITEKVKTKEDKKEKFDLVSVIRSSDEEGELD